MFLVKSWMQRSMESVHDLAATWGKKSPLALIHVVVFTCRTRSWSSLSGDGYQLEKIHILKLIIIAATLANWKIKSAGDHPHGRPSIAFLPKRSCHRTANALSSNPWKEDVYCPGFLGGKTPRPMVYLVEIADEGILEFVWVFLTKPGRTSCWRESMWRGVNIWEGHSNAWTYNYVSLSTLKLKQQVTRHVRP
jgi:hypothetical protein